MQKKLTDEQRKKIVDALFRVLQSDDPKVVLRATAQLIHLEEKNIEAENEAD